MKKKGEESKKFVFCNLFSLFEKLKIGEENNN